MHPTTIFLSHSHRDSEWAAWIAKSLEHDGFRVWMDRDDIAVGDSWIGQLEKSIIECDVMLALMSPSYFESAWAAREADLAIAREVPVIPVMIEPCDVQGVLQMYNWADLASEGREKGLARLLDALRAIESKRG